MTKKYLKLGGRILIFVLGTYMLLYSLAAIYIAFNKKKVADQLVAMLNDNINGTLTSKDVDLSLFANLPGIGVALKQVTITDSLYPQHKEVFLQAEKIDARVNIYNLLLQKPALTKISVANATVNIFTDTSGYSNQSVFKTNKQAPGKSSTSTPLRKLSLKNVIVKLNDRKRRKNHVLLANDVDVKLLDENGGMRLHTKADIRIGQLGFNWRKGAYLKNTLMQGEFDLFSKDRRLLFDSINIKLDGHPFNVTGYFNFNKPFPQFSLRLHTKNIMYEKVRSLLPQKISKSLSIIQANGPLDARVVVQGPLKAGEPLVNVFWSARQTDLATPFLDFEKASFTGSFQNQLIPGLPPGDPNSKIVLHNFVASWHGLPIKMPVIEMINLQDPLLTTSLRSVFSLPSINESLQSNVLDLQRGNADILLNYQGPIVRNEATNSLISGYINVMDGNILYAPRNVMLNNVNGRISFKNSDVLVERLNCNVFNTSVQMSGSGKQLLTLLNTAPSTAVIDWNIFTPGINLGDFLFLLKQKSANRQKKKAGKGTIAGAADKIDRLLEDGSLNVSVKANNVIYKKFKASNLAAEMMMLQDRYLFKNISMNHAGGTLQFDGSLLQAASLRNIAQLNAKLNNVDVSEILTAFENFGQDAITASNIDGKLTADIKSSIGITDAGKVLPETINSSIRFSLKNGTLKNFEPIKKIQDVAFKKRDFDNVRFAELKNTLTVQNREIHIDRMEIQSNVISLFVEGVYSTKGNTDISVQVPLSNLKKRKDDYIPKNKGVDAKTGTSIFLRGQPGQDGNIRFSLDLFKKFYKQKK